MLNNFLDDMDNVELTNDMLDANSPLLEYNLDNAQIKAELSSQLHTPNIKQEHMNSIESSPNHIYASSPISQETSMLQQSQNHLYKPLISSDPIMSSNFSPLAPQCSSPVAGTLKNNQISNKINLNSVQKVAVQQAEQRAMFQHSTSKSPLQINTNSINTPMTITQACAPTSLTSILYASASNENAYIFHGTNNNQPISDSNVQITAIPPDCSLKNNTQFSNNSKTLPQVLTVQSIGIDDKQQIPKVFWTKLLVKEHCHIKQTQSEVFISYNSFNILFLAHFVILLIYISNFHCFWKYLCFSHFKWYTLTLNKVNIPLR